MTKFWKVLCPINDEILECTLDNDSEEVAVTIAGYIAKKLAKRSKCSACKSLLKSSDIDIDHNHYLNLLSRGGLTVPSSELAEFCTSCFAIPRYH